MFRELDLGLSALLTDLAMCMNHYRLFSPGLYCCVHATVQLDEATRFCPGIIVQVNHGPLKLCAPDAEYQYFQGPPNFVLDVFHGNDMLDYEHRRACYERAQVMEYVAVRLMEPVEWIWNRLVDGQLTEVKTPDGELIMSTALPGLWIPPTALMHRNWWTIMSTIERGVSRLGHHQFMDTIWRKDRTEEENQQVLHDYKSGQMGQRA